MIYVIADDLTGANDTGVQFAKNGFKTVVLIPDLSTKNSVSLKKTIKNIKIESLDTLVFNIETREKKGDIAAYRLQKIMEQLTTRDKDTIYVKVDSTLRGNPGIEIETAYKYADKDICIFCPAFPSNKRVNINGGLFIKKQGKIKSDSMELKIPSLLDKQTNMTSGLINLSDVKKGPPEILKRINSLYRTGKSLIIIDAETNNDLNNIIKASFNFRGSVLYSGSGGLANYLAKNFTHNTVHKSSFITKYKKNKKGPVLIIAASRCEIMKKQIDYLSENKELFIQDLNVEKIMDNQEKYLKIYSSNIKTKIKNNFNVLVRPDPYFNSDKIINRLRVRKKLSFRDISLNIRGFLGRLSFEVVESDLINKLILTGGDTAQGVCFALGIKKLYVLKEILPGIPLLYGSGENGKQLQIVTKAGGFGRKDSLIKLLNSLSD